MRIGLLFLSVLLLFSCKSSSKKASSYLESGDYYKAFDYSYKKYFSEKSEKRNEIAPLLYQAYEKALIKDLETTKRLRLNKNPDNYKNLYYKYKSMSDRQKKIETINPMIVGGKTYNFTRKDYSKTLEAAKSNYVSHIYKNAITEYNQKTVGNFRNAYQMFKEINYIEPSYKDATALENKAKNNGIIKVQVSNSSSSFYVSPSFRNQLNQFNSFGIPLDWTRFYHGDNNINDVDFYIDINFNNYTVNRNVSTNTNNFFREERISLGYVDVTINGETVKEERFQTVTANVQNTYRLSRANISAVVTLRNKDNYIISSRNAISNYEWSDTKTTYTGDVRALSSTDRSNLERNQDGYPGDSRLLNECEQRFIRELNNIFSANANIGMDIKRP